MASSSRRCPSIHPSMCPSIHPSVHSSIHLSIRPAFVVSAPRRAGWRRSMARSGHAQAGVYGVRACSPQWASGV